MSEAEWLSKSLIKPKKRLSQNFLIDQNIAKKIIKLVQGQLADQIIEIGPGLGILTELMLQEQYRVRAIEIDEDLLGSLNDRLGTYPQIELINQDAMDYDYKNLEGPLWILVSNLPYNIGTRLLVKLMIDVPVIHRYVVMVQKEVADRIIANAGDKEYGALSVASQLFTKPKKQFDVHSNSFIPRPKVTSTVISLQREHIIDEEERGRAFNLAKTAFQQRRKTIKKSLSSEQINFDKLSEIGVDQKSRAEELSPEQYLLIANMVSNEN